MPATRIIDSKQVWPDGTIVQMIVWQLPQPAPDRPHGFKYRLYCGRGGRCLVRYDNETGKGDHKHIGDREMSYRFRSLTGLIDDFRADIRRLVGDRYA